MKKVTLETDVSEYTIGVILLKKDSKSLKSQGKQPFTWGITAESTF
jgi:hypothetical protein